MKDRRTDKYVNFRQSGDTNRQSNRQVDRQTEKNRQAE